MSDVDAAFDRFEREDVEAVAVCLFNSYLDGTHEFAAAQRLAARGFDGPISVSTVVAPVMGEFERTSTTVLNAYVAPRTLSYLRTLERRLIELGLHIPLLLVQSNGGAISLDELGERPVTLLLSGPASGVGALDFYRSPIGSDDLVSMEIGGTSCDVILMSRGKVGFTDLLDIGGYRCVTPTVDVHTVGAGGGAIAHVDPAGLLHVGPRGAGANPGPACYGLGGDEPTVTDAEVVLGRMRPGEYANGAVTIDRALAASAIETSIASRLGLSVERAAMGIVQLMDQKLLHAVQRVTSERGHDPARLTLVACGGAGPLHASAIGRALGCPAAYVPRLSGTFCALGMLHSNVRHDFFAMHFAELRESAHEALETAFRSLERRAHDALVREGFAEARIDLVRGLDLRYRGQQWDVSINLDHGSGIGAMRDAFQREHERLFGHMQPQGTVEITKVRVSGIGRIDLLKQAEVREAASEAKPRILRKAWINARTGWRDTPIYAGRDLFAGHAFTGPAIVEEETTTLLIGARDRLEVDAAGNYRIRFME
jgi:N-methylhydantoinase A